MSGKAGMIATLGDMGFGPNRAARALKATGLKVGSILTEQLEHLKRLDQRWVQSLTKQLELSNLLDQKWVQS